MIKTLRLRNFKNFEEASLRVGPLTILIGANATGKSNIRDAFRFLHGIGRGYSLAEILGEKYVGGERVWSGIRGGTREVAYDGSDSFTIAVDMEIDALRAKQTVTWQVSYSTEVKLRSPPDKPPRIYDEFFGSGKSKLFQIKGRPDKNTLKAAFWRQKGVKGAHPPSRSYFSGTPVVCQVAEDEEPKIRVARNWSRRLMRRLESLRFLDLSPTQMRIPSLPGQTTLGDRGENLSSVLLAICDDASRKETLLEWVRKLTPMDVDDLDFDHDAAGRILLILKERNGRAVSAGCASDGTLRFLAILAAMFGPAPAEFYFIEELENGIHPTRLGLLIDLIESQTRQRGIQVVATSHSPLLLQFLSPQSLENASIVYRLPEHSDARIKRILEIPDAARVIKEQSISVLHASSWFEDILDFADDAVSEAAGATGPGQLGP